jgi:hypothetical protein
MNFFGVRIHNNCIEQVARTGLFFITTEFIRYLTVLSVRLWDDRCVREWLERRDVALALLKIVDWVQYFFFKKVVE